ncbi:MAG: helix-turn-helix transcriptional regulator [Ginsengibacter sp.]
MYSLTHKHEQSFFFLKQVAGREKIKVQDDTQWVNNDMAAGYFKAFSMQDGIQYLCANYNTREDFYVHKMPIASEFFTLRIDEISHASNALIIANRKFSNEAYSTSYSVSLLSSLEEFAFFASENSAVKTLEISIPYRCFFRKLHVDCSYNLLKNYLALKTRKSPVDVINLSLKSAFLKIIRETDKEALNLNGIEEKINKLLAIFFSDIKANLVDFIKSGKVKISKEEISRLMIVWEYLGKDINSAPPKFAALTKMALMSGTSLKTKFKKMYGYTVFEYFQKRRMQKARILLLTHKYSVRQVGLQLGYANLSNFTIAFKKEFNQLPHHLIK